MKQPTPKTEPFSTDKPLVKDRIYQITNGTEKKCVSMGSAIRMGLKGRWNVLREFER